MNSGVEKRLTVEERLELVDRCRKTLKRHGKLTDYKVLRYISPDDSLHVMEIMYNNRDENTLSLYIRGIGRIFIVPTHELRKVSLDGIWSSESAGLRVLHTLRNSMILDDLSEV